MLALTRKVGETIVIGDYIEVTLLSISKDQAKIGINAPKHISIHRKEIYLQIKDENAEAIKSSKQSVNKMKKIFQKD